MQEHDYAGNTMKDFMDYVFSARHYGIQEDIFRGDYMGPCDNAVSTPEGIACSCNQGGHFVILNQFVDLGASDDKRRITFKNIPEGDYSYPFSTCYAKDAPRPTVTIPIVSSFFSFLESGSDSLGTGVQVVVTQNTCDLLNARQLAVFDFESLGPQDIQGIEGSINMYQLNCVRGRAFPPLEQSETIFQELPLPVLHAVHGSRRRSSVSSLMDRPKKGSTSKRKGSVQSDCDTSVMYSHRSLFRATELQYQESDADTAAVLEVLFGPYSGSKKVKMLQETCQRFNLEVPSRSAYQNNEAYVQELISRLSRRTDSLIDFRNSIYDPSRGEAEKRRAMKSGAFRRSGFLQDKTPAANPLAAAPPSQPGSHRPYPIKWQGLPFPTSVGWQPNWSAVYFRSDGPPEPVQVVTPLRPSWSLTPVPGNRPSSRSSTGRRSSSGWIPVSSNDVVTHDLSHDVSSAVYYRGPCEVDMRRSTSFASSATSESDFEPMGSIKLMPRQRDDSEDAVVPFDKNF